ncbi:MAG: hypothetical protein KatS3mg128_0969 [Silanimonas sp.]|nr:MAG: hypothetical protein KatS3mg128_0969 [Silanimonas sp.]
MPTPTPPLLVEPAVPPRAALLWLPALGVPARKYRPLAVALAARGILCAVHEWRGTGDCPRRPGRGRDWGYREWLEEDIPGSAAALAARAPELPRLLDGHSIGGQMALLAAALGSPAAGLVVAASGVPDWRCFPRWSERLAVAGFALVLPLLTRLFGHYPGDRLGFAGREAGQLMRDWAQTVRTGRYAGLRGLPDDLEARLARLDTPLLGLGFCDDWLVPEASWAALVGKTRARTVTLQCFDAESLGVAPDHFAWLRAPAAPAAAIADWWQRQPAAGTAPPQPLNC